MWQNSKKKKGLQNDSMDQYTVPRQIIAVTLMISKMRIKTLALNPRCEYQLQGCVWKLFVSDSVTDMYVTLMMDGRAHQMFTL